MISEAKKIPLRDNILLHAEVVENGSPFWLIVTHGLGEHSGRHKYMYSLFSHYFNICIYDLRGHGKSEGKEVFIDDFNEFSKDLDEVVHFLKNNYSMDKFVLFGHSMGGLITASYMQNTVKEGSYPLKVFLSGPAIGGTGNLGKVFKMAPMKIMNTLTQIPLSLPVEGLLDLSKLSHDPRVYENYITDELVHLKIHTKLFLEILKAGKDVFSRPLRVKCDLYCAVGTHDGIVDSQSTIEYFKTIEKNAKVLEVKGGYHELHNEIEKFRTPYFEFLKESVLKSIFDEAL